MDDADLISSFVHLFTHRFASHCCEALFLRAASKVSEELLAPAASQDVPSPDNIYVSLENLFLHTLAELEGSVGYLITDKWASHVLRVLLLVLAGEPLKLSSTSCVLHSKRKESIAIEGLNDHELEKPRTVPEAFREALQGLIAESVAGLDTAQLRALATHPDGNPTLQVLLKLELTQFGKQKAKDRTSIISKLLPDDPITSDSDSAAFISSLMYHPVGSHLVEQIVKYAPAKMFKCLNKEIFKNRLDSFARNEVASYVVCRVLERMGQDDLREAHERLISVLPGLLGRNRTMVITTLIERCTIRGVDTQEIAAQIAQATHGRDGFDITSFLKLDQSSDGTGNAAGTPHVHVQSSSTEYSTALSSHAEPVKIHFNLLAQAMLRVPGALSSLVLDSLVQLSLPILMQIAKDPIASRTVQAALTTETASIIQRRKLIQLYYGHIGEMALDRNASHIVDCIWEGTHGLAFIRERIAEELAENETHLRDSPYGRAVWKNWKMDIYKHRRHDWIRQSKAKASNDGFQSFSELDRNKNKSGVSKTPLDLARERHVKQKEEKEAKKYKVRSRSFGNRESRYKTGPATTATVSSDRKEDRSTKI